MNTEPLISIIIPVYGVEQYLDECLESVVSQTYRNLQIILIDDGSPDRCPQMCDDWAVKDSRITVIHQKNSGPAAARNAGLDAATGDLIGFVDSDDWIDTKMYETLLGNMVASGADVSIIGKMAVRGDEHTPNNHPDVHLEGDDDLALKLVNSLPQHGRIWMDRGVYDKLYKRELFDGVRFAEGLIAEDLPVTYEVLLRIKRFVLDTTPLYYYRYVFDSRSNERSHIDLGLSDYAFDMFERMRRERPKTAPYFLYSYALVTTEAYKRILTVDEDSAAWKSFRRRARRRFRNNLIGLTKRIDERYLHIPRSQSIQWMMIGFFPAIFRLMYRSYLQKIGLR